MGSFFPAQQLQDLLIFNAGAGHQGVVDFHNAVPGQNSQFGRRPPRDHINDHDGVFLDRELHPNSRKIALHLLLYALHFPGRYVGRVGIQILQKRRNRIFDDLCGIDGIYIGRFDQFYDVVQFIPRCGIPAHRGEGTTLKGGADKDSQGQSDRQYQGIKNRISLVHFSVIKSVST